MSDDSYSSLDSGPSFLVSCIQVASTYYIYTAVLLPLPHEWLGLQSFATNPSDAGDRTWSFLDARQTLYQLSHIPACGDLSNIAHGLGTPEILAPFM